MRLCQEPSGDPPTLALLLPMIPRCHSSPSVRVQRPRFSPLSKVMRRAQGTRLPVSLPPQLSAKWLTVNSWGCLCPLWGKGFNERRWQFEHSLLFYVKYSWSTKEQMKHFKYSWLIKEQPDLWEREWEEHGTKRHCTEQHCAARSSLPTHRLEGRRCGIEAGTLEKCY